MFGATLMLAFSEIRRHLLRSFLTTLGIIIGVAAVITMVTLGNGVTASIKNQISSLGSNVLIVLPVQGDRGTPRPFKQADIEAARKQIAGVEDISGSVSTSATAFHNGQSWRTSVQGAGIDFLRARSVEIELGRTFSAEEESAGQNVCLIGPKVWRAVFPAGTIPLGAKIRLNNVSCSVIGVIKERGQSGGAGEDSDNVAMVPLKMAQRRFIGSADIHYFVIKYNAAYSSASVKEALVGLLRERRLLQGAADDDFNIVDTAQVNEALGSATDALTAMVAMIAGISLLVGGIGIMNIMLVSVTERTREIGIRLAIGALAREVQLQFLTEAVVLCCFGGIVGIALAFVLSSGMAAVIDVPFIFNPLVNAMSFLFSALMGIAFGYYPARRASRLDPIEALRHE